MIFQNFIEFEYKLLIIILLLFRFIESSIIYPVHNLIITTNLNHINFINENYFFYSLNTKGIGIIFDYNSEINLIPYHLLKKIKKLVEIYLQDCYSFIRDKENNYQELYFFGYMNNDLSFHFITDQLGITFPNDILFPKFLDSIGKFSFCFLSKESQDNIIIGKNLMDLMEIKFLEKNEFIINNRSFTTLIEE